MLESKKINIEFGNIVLEIVSSHVVLSALSLQDAEHNLLKHRNFGPRWKKSKDSTRKVSMIMLHEQQFV